MSTARQLFRILQDYSIPLIVGVIAGLAVANVDDHFYEKLVDYHVFGEGVSLFGHSLTAHFLINGIFMVFFFGVATKEITDSILPGGSLNPINKAINPLLGTLGGILGPAGLYFLLTFVFYGGTDSFSEVSNGWGIPTATDIALAWLVARIVFGPLHNAVNFLLLLAVADDAIGLAIIAIFYPDPHFPIEPVWVLLIAGGAAVAFAMRRMGVSSWLPYIFVAGAMSWFGLLLTGVEAALALVIIVPFLPSHKTKAHYAGDGGQSGLSSAHGPGNAHGTLERFEHHTKPFVDIGLFFFAFANVGAPFANINPVTWIVLLSLVVGKTVGISLFSGAASRFGFPLPGGVGLKHLVVVGLIAGLGLTVALFVAGKAFPGSDFEEPAKIGAVLSAGVSVLAFIAGAALKVKDGAGDRVGQP